MKIYQFWSQRVIPLIVNGKETPVRFRAGSNESMEAAEQAVEERIRKYRSYISAVENHTELPDRTRQEEYANPICEELCHRIDDRNLVTRNRYGALVLNSEELLFLDVDHVPYTFMELLKKICGMTIPEDRERLRLRLEGFLHLPEFQGVGMRLYATSKGFRILLSLPGLETLQSPVMAELFRKFNTDPLYADLCRKQQCFRARLTPKPARMGMKTMLKFRFPYAEEDRDAIASYLAEYNAKSEGFAVCRLIAQLGKRFNSPAIEYHDQMTKCGKRLPLA